MSIFGNNVNLGGTAPEENKGITEGVVPEEDLEGAGTDPVNEEVEVNDREDFFNTINEAVFVDDLQRLSTEDLGAVLESQEYALLEQKGLVGKRTRVTLSKKDDLERRIGMIEIELAKQANHPAYKKLVKSRVLKNEAVKEIDKAFRTKALKLAKIDQKEYIKGMPVGGKLK